MEKFEEYFQKADLDRDGRISGAEAVSFLQGSNLSRQVLAQIWMHADQNRTGFLGRPEFYNALKLVTVAQSKRELTPDIVKAALYGPASAKIPPPQITTAAAPPSTQMGTTVQPSPQNFGFRGPAPSTSSANQQPGTMLSTAGMIQQPRPSPSVGMYQQFGMPSSAPGGNQQLLHAQPASTMNQQFGGQVIPTTTSMNQQFGQLRPSNTILNQQFGQAPSNSIMNQQIGQAPTNMITNQQFLPSQGNQMRPPSSLASGPTPRPPQSTSLNVSGPMAGLGPSNTNNAWNAGKSVSAVAPNPQDQLSAFTATAAKDPKGLVSSGTGSNYGTMFSGDVFSANQSSSQKNSSSLPLPMSSLPTSSAIVPVTAPSQSSAKSDPFEALQSSLVKPSAIVPAVQTPSVQRPNQQAPTQVTPSVLPSGVQANQTTESPQTPWPKMTRPGVQKYAKVFMEVDSDRDGKITGDQARSLFLSWRLPREVLKQVWDLSDQDSDSMLSLREFCIALYLMERYREGRALPSVLPNSVMLDETLMSMVPPPTTYGSTGWGPASGISPQQGFPGAQSVRPGIRPTMQPVVSQTDRSMQYNQQNVVSGTAENSHANQLSNGQAYSLDGKGQDAAETNEKDDKENMLMDSREKLEFYRTKMQDLVLYKSRCDNRLNEITERARADKNEAELLEKKYQEKYKQVSEIHSKLTIEDAAFREVQARKMELQQAITKMEQGGSADGILQVRADRIQSDLEELLKALTDRCKKHNVEVKSSALIELPPGWQPGVPEFAVIWDEDWDKFEDEGFSFDVALPENSKSASIEREDSSPTHSISPSNAATPDKPFASAFDAESMFSADESKSPQESPGRQPAYESPSKEYSDDHFRKSFDGDTETHRSFDEPNWGDFDNNDDVDSVWGFNAKEPDHVKHDEKYFFGSNDFDASPDKSGSPQADSSFQKNNFFTFEDSVPGSPVSKAGNSPRYNVESRDPFNSFSRFDSFSTHDQGTSPRRENFTRFDSMSSSTGFDRSSNYSFDDSDPFGSSGPFKVLSDTNKEKF